MTDHGYQGFNGRRKRQIDFPGPGEQQSRKRGGETSFGISWPSGDKGMEEFDSVYEPEAAMEQYSLKKDRPPKQPGPAVPAPDLAGNRAATTFRLGGKDIQLGPLPKRANFSEECQKVTIYLKKDLAKLVKELKQSGYVESLSSLAQEAITRHLTERER